MIKASKLNRGLLLSILPGFYIAASLYLDFFDHMGMITPFCAVMGLLYMALTYRPIVMVPWAIVYTGIICAIFLTPRLFTLFSGHSYYDQYVIPIVRAGTYVAVGVLASYLCIALNRVRNSEEELTHILENIPWPILTSDQNGKVLYWNASAAILLPELIKSEGLLNYFDLLVPPEFHGRTITEYLKRIEKNDQENTPLKLSVRGVPHKGHTRVIEQEHKRVLLTILKEEAMLPLPLP